MWVVCICADWCSTCRAWRPPLEELAQKHRDWTWRWLDFDEGSEMIESAGLDVQSFPVVLIGRGEHALFMGTVEPYATQLEQLILRLQRDGEPLTAGIGAALAALLFPRLDGPEMYPF